VEWLKVKALRSSSSTAEKKKKERERRRRVSGYSEYLSIWNNEGTECSCPIPVIWI
jgi:hypothetical protein